MTIPRHTLTPARPFPRNATRLLLCMFVLAPVLLAGCASRPINDPIEMVDPQAGYRPYLRLPKRQHNDPHTLFVLSFSGGGTRAAAFSYGVLEELRRDTRPRGAGALHEPAD